MHIYIICICIYIGTERSRDGFWFIYQIAHTHTQFLYRTNFEISNNCNTHKFQPIDYFINKYMLIKSNGISAALVNATESNDFSLAKASMLDV